MKVSVVTPVNNEENILEKNVFVISKYLEENVGSDFEQILIENGSTDHTLETAKRIVANIWGFDLNPLAVIAARTNYLFALGDLIQELTHIEIPIYLADSVLTPTRISRDLFSEFLEVPTSVYRFQIPAIWVREGGFLLAKAAPSKLAS